MSGGFTAAGAYGPHVDAFTPSGALLTAALNTAGTRIALPSAATKKYSTFNYLPNIICIVIYVSPQRKEKSFPYSESGEQPEPTSSRWNESKVHICTSA